MSELEKRIRQEANWAMKYAHSPFGINIKDEFNFSYLILVNIISFLLVPVIAIIFNDWVDRPTFFNNWITNEPASNGLLLGLILTVIIFVINWPIKLYADIYLHKLTKRLQEEKWAELMANVSSNKSQEKEDRQLQIPFPSE